MDAVERSIIKSLWLIVKECSFNKQVNPGLIKKVMSYLIKARMVFDTLLRRYLLVVKINIMNTETIFIDVMLYLLDNSNLEKFYSEISSISTPNLVSTLLEFFY